MNLRVIDNEDPPQVKRELVFLDRDLLDTLLEELGERQAQSVVYLRACLFCAVLCGASLIARLFGF